MAKSTTSLAKSKPEKPYTGYPLFPHATGRWAKKIRGKLHYFGKWDEPEGALERFNREWPYLKDGRTPPPVDMGDGITVATLCNAFLNAKRALVESGELSPSTFASYYRVCAMLVDAFGDRRVDDLRPDDFQRFRLQLAKRFGPVALKDRINRCRVVLKFAYDQRLIDRPVAYGQSFNRPSAKMLRQVRNEAGIRMFEADELRTILAASDPILRAMVLLAVNCGFGNSDISTLPESAVDLQAGWIDYPRPKTQIPRHVPLWPETSEALRTALAKRPKPRDGADAGLVFLTSYGRRWVRTQPSKKDPKTTVPVDALSQKFARLLKKLDIDGHRNFYSLRHGFETIGGECRDQIAVNAIMGHVDPTMAGVYRERISDERLQAVADTVHAWLWPEADEAGGTATDAAGHVAHKAGKKPEHKSAK